MSLLIHNPHWKHPHSHQCRPDSLSTWYPVHMYQMQLRPHLPQSLIEIKIYRRNGSQRHPLLSEHEIVPDILITNYSNCRLAMERLEALQKIVKDYQTKQEALTENKN